MIAILKKLHNSLYIKCDRIYYFISYIINFQKLKHLPPSIDSISAVLDQYSMTKEHKCYFIQIGAFDGITNDLIYSFVNESDWYGCLVEPIRENFIQLTQNYIHKKEKLTFLNVAIGNNNGVADMYTIKKSIENNLPEWCYQLSSFDYQVIASHIRFEPEIKNLITKEQVQIITLKTLLKNLNYPRFDVLIIDTEGYDYEILKSNDWAILKPDIIIFEFIHMGLEKFSTLLHQFNLLEYKCYVASENCLCLNKATSKLDKKIQKKPFYYKSKLKIN